MSNLKNINAALLLAYQSIRDPDLPTAYEGKDFSQPASAPWARVINFPAEHFVATLGDGGEDKTTGFFQVDYFVPENDGTGRILGYADATLEKFKNGSRFEYGGQEVQVWRSSLTPLRRDSESASYRITLSIFWVSRTIR